MTTLTNEPIVLDRPNQIALYRLSVLKTKLKMESHGMKSRGGALRPQIAAEFGLKARDSYATFITEIQRRIDAGMAELQANATEEVAQ